MENDERGRHRTRETKKKRERDRDKEIEREKERQRERQRDRERGGEIERVRETQIQGDRERERCIPLIPDAWVNYNNGNSKCQQIFYNNNNLLFTKDKLLENFLATDASFKEKHFISELTKKNKFIVFIPYVNKINIKQKQPSLETERKCTCLLCTKEINVNTHNKVQFIDSFFFFFFFFFLPPRPRCLGSSQILWLHSLNRC